MFKNGLVIKSGKWIKFTLTDDPLVLLTSHEEIPEDVTPEQLETQFPMLVPARMDEENLAIAMRNVHQTEDGFYVGIYNKESIDPVANRRVPASVTPARRGDGCNIRFINPKTNETELLSFVPQSLNAELVERKEELPEGRQETTREGWVPKI